MEVNYIIESFKFMFFGMSIVFIFLFLLIQVVKLQTIIIKKKFSEDKTDLLKAKTNNKEQKSKEIAIIIAAISEFRK